MTVRPTSRIILFATLAVFLILTLAFLRPESPLSPEVRAPGHLPIPDSQGRSKGHGSGMSDGGVGGGGMHEILDGGVVMPHLGNETVKAELGRSSWRLLHTMMARFPDEPSHDQQETLRSFVLLFARMYPCGECATHFQSTLAKFPPQVSSRSSAAGWACHVHNEVNKRLQKDIFDCSKIGDFYDCGCGDEEENGKGEDEGGGKEKGKKEDDTVLGPQKVEINDEPPTNG